VSRSRRERLAGRLLADSREGRLLCCSLSLSFSSGESQLASSGFFDLDDRPPWDTWIWNLPDGDRAGVLVSWVPSAYEGLVSRGIDMNPYGCIYWLFDEPHGRATDALVRALAATGIRA
jgi:hypothetical protein